MNTFNKSVIELPYGNQVIKLSVNTNQYDVIEKTESQVSPLTNNDILDKLQNPIDSEKLNKLIKNGESVVIVLPDATRYIASQIIVQQLLILLKQANVKKEDITFLIGGGIHRFPTPEETIQIIGKSSVKKYKVFFHNANDDKELVDIGITKRGTRVRINSALIKADHVIQIGGISFHYIAGFSGGRKSIIPGCGAETTIQQNHKLAFDQKALSKSSGISSGNLQGNPVHEDMVEAVSFLKPTFAINTVLNKHKEIIDVYSGHWLTSHLKGCQNYKKENSVTVNNKCDTVIVSAGGYPKDLNLIQSHKALEHASKILKPNGVMILLAECSQGLGREDLLDWFVPGGSDATAKKLLDDYKVYGQTAWGIRWKSEKYKLYLVSEIEKEPLKKMGIKSFMSINSVLDEIDDLGRIYIMPDGLTTLPILLEK